MNTPQRTLGTVNNLGTKTEVMTTPQGTPQDAPWESPKSPRRKGQDYLTIPQGTPQDV